MIERGREEYDTSKKSDDYNGHDFMITLPNNKYVRKKSLFQPKSIRKGDSVRYYIISCWSV